ncbi:MAG: hypothetical protein EPN93_16775 [Spirochaetes bacterium]|nr:MAG: hypothetical protein EPN93_16775 [Spirochaetota bacterium]
MNNELSLLLATAGSLGFIHTILGPDHYIPFIMMAQARAWSVSRTMWITLLCGIGHIAGSVVLGVLGISLGLALSGIEQFEEARGNIAAWLLIAFGFAYLLYGLKAAYRHRTHRHAHEHDPGHDHNGAGHDHGHAHLHPHSHEGGHLHVHDAEGKKKNITPWLLFTIFVFGPCESLIPILMYPAATRSGTSVALVALVFGGATILTMMGVVLVSLYGITLLPVKKFERYTHALAGFSILLCGLAIRFLGL